MENVRQQTVHLCYNDQDIKKTLLTKVKQHQPEDEATHEHGHTVLRLPVARCELNPIELAWALVKGYVAKDNIRYSLEEVQQLTPEGFTHKTMNMWRNSCRHVVDVENDYIKKDGIVEDTVEEMTFTIGEDSDDEALESNTIDDDDRQLIDRALQQQQSSTTDTVPQYVQTQEKT